MTRFAQRGAASVEYVVVSLVVVAIVSVPFGTRGLSVIDLVLNALRGFQAHSTYLLSMP